jgi:MFS family permease
MSRPRHNSDRPLQRRPRLGAAVRRSRRRPAAGPAGRAVRSRRAALTAVFPRQYWLLAAGIFVLLAGVDMCFPFETTYLNSRLHVSMTVIGLVLGLPLMASMPLHMLGGALADRYGRKPIMAVGAGVIAVLYLTFATASAVWQIGIAIALEAAFGWPLFLTGSNAMIADLIVFERRAEAYSITRAAQHVGMVVGPLAGAAVIAADPTYRSMFFAGAGICVLYVVIVLGLFRETRPAAAGRQPFGATLRGYRQVLRDRRYLAFCAVTLLPLYGFGQIWSMLPVMLRERHGASAHTWALLLAFYAATVAVLQYPVIRGVRGRNHLLLMALASLLVGVGLAGAVLAPFGGLTLLFIFLLGQGVVLLVPISSTVAAELAPLPLRGRYMGVWTLVQMGGYALGPTFGGWAMDAFGSGGGALIMGSAGALGSTLFLLMAWRTRIPLPAGRSAARAALASQLAEETPPPEPPGG